MLTRRTLYIVVFLVAAALVVWGVVSSDSRLHPPVVRLVSIEPAGMFDDTGMELRLLTLAVSNENPENPGDFWRNVLYVADSVRGVEIRVSNSWKQVHWATNLWGSHIRLKPGDQDQRALALIPGGSDGCRVWVRYAVPTLSPKGVLEFAVARLPLSIRSRFSYKFWRWVGFSELYRPGYWRQIPVELGLPLTSGQPGAEIPVKRRAIRGAEVETRTQAE
jgi:hypothetical protein